MADRCYVSRDGVEYPLSYIEQWGRNGVGDGYGPFPVPTHLTECRTGRTTPEGEPALERCPGELVAMPTKKKESTLVEGLHGCTFARPFWLETSDEELVEITAEAITVIQEG